METKALEYILEIARCRSITKAARSLGISQSALSQILLRVEREIGAVIFIRQKRALRLTEAGELYIEAAAKIVDTKNRFLADLQDLTAERHIRVGVTSQWGMAMLLEILPEFHALFPDVPVELVQRSYSALMSEYAQYRIDIAVSTYHISDPLPEDGEVLREEEMKLFVNKYHPFSLAHAGESSISEQLLRSELDGMSFIRSAKGSLSRRMEDAMFERTGFAPRTFCEVNNYITFINLVEANLGFAFVSADYASLSDKVSVWSMEPKLLRRNILLVRPGFERGKEADYLIDRIKNYKLFK